MFVRVIKSVANIAVKMNFVSCCSTEILYCDIFITASQWYNVVSFARIVYIKVYSNIGTSEKSPCSSFPDNQAILMSNRPAQC